MQQIYRKQRNDEKKVVSNMWKLVQDLYEDQLQLPAVVNIQTVNGSAIIQTFMIKTIYRKER